MGFLDSLEKLINEHGSAAILKERIELLNDRYADLERKAQERAQALTEAQAENKRLKEEVARLTDEVKRLARADGNQGDIDEIREKILLALAQRGEMRMEQIANAVQSGVEVTRFHVEEMEETGMIYGSHSALGPSAYSLAQEGRRYLIGKGMIR